MTHVPSTLRQNITISAIETFLSNLKDFSRHKLGIDKPVAWTLVNKVWSILRGPVSLYFLLLYLSPGQQGMWYSFVNLGALTLLAELGFTMIITQFVSHEFANLRMENEVIVGESYYLDRFFSLIRYAIRFYVWVIPAAIVILAGAGLYLFNDQPRWVYAAWILFSIVGGINLFGSLMQSIYQGLDKVIDIQKNIFIGMLLMPCFNWLLLAFGFHIWALVFGNLFGFVVMNILLYRRAASFWRQVLQYKPIQNFTWFHEIVSLQWRYAISWASGYFIFSFYVPAIYKLRGEIVAGQVGITITLIRAVFSMAYTWMDSKIPRLNMLIEKKEYAGSYWIFFKSSVQGLFFYILGAAALIVLVLLINYYSAYGQRFLEPGLILLFLSAETVDLITGFMAIYLRAHKTEPFYWFSLILGILIPLTIVGTVPYYGLEGMLIGLNIVKWFVALPIAILIFTRHQKKVALGQI